MFLGQIDVPRDIRKVTKKNTVTKWPKKSVETYSPANAVARNLGQKAQVKTQKAIYVITMQNTAKKTHFKGVQDQKLKNTLTKYPNPHGYSELERI